MTADSSLYAWMSIGDSSNPPERVRVEICKDCAAIVEVATYDRHGLFHRDLERLAAVANTNNRKEQIRGLESN
jgi:hypothetical protein